MIVYQKKYQGNIKIPASKSDSQRAILCAGLAKGESILLGVGKSKDELAMLENVKNFGAAVERTVHEYRISGISSFPQELNLFLGESGLGARLMTSLCLVQKGKFKLMGEGSLITRPFTFFKENFQGKVPLIQDTNDCLPMEIQGGYEGGELTVSGKQSSQYISGLLMALPLAQNDSLLHVEKLNSKPYVQMTLNTLQQFGIVVENHELCDFIVSGNQKYLSTTYKVEGDWSSASYWLVASALGQEISVSGLSMTSLQADRIILKAFAKANCSVITENEQLSIDGKNRQAFEFDLTDAPDLFPTLAVLAALTEGKSTLFGLDRLEHKESNRGITIQSEFKKLGIEVDLDATTNALIVHGKMTVFGGKVFSNNDHRIAMSLAVLGMFAEHPVEIEHPEAVEKSYPSFWEDLERLG